MAAVLAAGVVGSWSAQAGAQSRSVADRANARQLGYDGVEAYERGQYDVAVDKLTKAYGQLPVPSLGLWSARALVKVGKLVEASERYLEVSRMPLNGGDVEVQKKAQADARTELEATQQLTPTLQIEIEGVPAGSVTVKVDGTPYASQLVGESTPLNPGEHVIVGEANGEVVSRSVKLSVKEQGKVKLSFQLSNQPAAPAAPAEARRPGAPAQDDRRASSSIQRTAGWVTLAGGAAGLVVGGITGAIALSRSSTLNANPGCPEQCPYALSNDVDSLNTMRHVSTVAFIAGGVVATTGIVLVLTAPAKSSTTALWLSPTSAGLRGTF